MLSRISDIENPDIVRYHRQFYDLVGQDVINQDEIILLNLKAFLEYVSSTSCPAAAQSPAMHQAYILYVLAINLLEYKQEFEDGDKFYSEVYIPYICIVVSKYFGHFRKLMNQLESKTYAHIKDKASTIIDFSLVMYNISPNIIKSDTQQIFFKSSFVEISPSILDQPKDHFYGCLQYIYYNYIKSKTNGLIPTDSLLEVKNAIGARTDSRYNIYEFGLRSYQIQKICLTSDTLQTISTNFDTLRNSLISNQLLQILRAAYFPDIEDEKILLLKVNSNDFNISELENEIPLVCRLLRAVHIRTCGANSISDKEKIHIRANIFSAIDKWLKQKMTDSQSRKISSALSVSLSNSLLSGTYIDPRTMKRIDFSGIPFTNQFKKFIELMLVKITEDAV